MIGTLDELKGKLDIPASDTSRDDALVVILEAAGEHVLERAGYLEESDTTRVDYFRNLRENRQVYLPKRAVASITSVQGRVPMATADWTDLSGDLIDPDLGLFMIVSNVSGWRDPRYFTERRSKGYRWPVVKVTYSVTGIGSDDNAPSGVKDAVLALARYWFEQDAAGAADSVTLGQVAKHFRDAAIPGHIEARLSAFDRTRARWV